MIDIVESTTANLFFGHNEIVESVLNINNRQPEIAEETGSSFIAQTITDSIAIPMANLKFTTVERWKTSSNDAIVSDNRK